MESKIKQYWANNKKQNIDILIAIVMIISAVIFNAVMHPCIVVGNSMSPTLENAELVHTVTHFTENEIRRGTIVVYQIEDTQMVKRVIGLPGEHLFLQDGQIWIFADGMKYPSGYDFEPILDEKSGVLYHTVYSVPQGHYFCVGDNRNNSLDSRVYGAVSFQGLERLVREK